MGKSDFIKAISGPINMARFPFLVFKQLVPSKKLRHSLALCLSLFYSYLLLGDTFDIFGYNLGRCKVWLTIIAQNLPLISFEWTIWNIDSHWSGHSLMDPLWNLWRSRFQLFGSLIRAKNTLSWPHKKIIRTRHDHFFYIYQETLLQATIMQTFSNFSLMI